MDAGEVSDAGEEEDMVVTADASVASVDGHQIAASSSELITIDTALNFVGAICALWPFWRSPSDCEAASRCCGLPT